MLKHEKRMKPLLQASASPLAKIYFFANSCVYMHSSLGGAARETGLSILFFYRRRSSFRVAWSTTAPLLHALPYRQEFAKHFSFFPCEQKFLSSKLNFLHGACGWMYSKSTGPSFPPASRSTACRREAPGWRRRVCVGGIGSEGRSNRNA